MKYQLEYLKGLEDKTIRVTFTDGCCADFLILDTSHFEESDDIAGEMLALHCQSADHPYQEIGSLINFKAYDIQTIQELEDQITRLLNQ
jgi:hypothetical protein